MPRGMKHELKGQRFGRWLVLRETAERDGSSVLWLCRCDCGTERGVRATLLTSGQSKSCGCLRNDLAAERCRATSYRKLPPGTAAFHLLIRGYKRGALERNLEWALTEKDVAKLTKMNCWYCGSAPATIRHRKGCNGDYIYNGIDRVDNEQGYTPDNVVPCCATCNMAKAKMGYSEFLDWVHTVARHQDWIGE